MKQTTTPFFTRKNLNGKLLYLYCIALLSGATAAFGQTNGSRAGQEKLESYYTKLQAFNILQSVQKSTGASNADMLEFTNYYQDKIYAADRQEFWNKVSNGSVTSDADIQNYAQTLEADYVNLYRSFQQVKTEFPNSIPQNSPGRHRVLSPQPCNPACDNIDFSNGNLNGWYAYYRVNSSTPTGYVFSAPVGGACGPVTAAAWDPNTSTYQVSLTSGPGLDPIAGALIPVVCPGSSFSCRIGDGPIPQAQMGTLSQTFTVTQQNANFVYMYAVVLENPAHNYYQQPFFNVVMLDQNNDTIPNCGNYSVVSGPGLPGYKSIYYAPDADTVYCKPWSTVFVPLQNYIGQCVTIIINTSDCALGGHFGYAYFAAKCSVGIISNARVICKGNDTLTAPSGVATYKWTGPCIIGPNNNQKCIIGCAGTYKCALASIANALCADTVSITIPPYTPMTLSISGTNIKCNGGNNGSAAVSVSGGVQPYTYLWSPGGGTNSSKSNLTAGTYKVVVTDSNGCRDTASIILTQPVALAASIASFNNLKCYGDNSGSATVSVSGGTPGYNYIWAPSGGTSATASNLPAGSYTVTVTDAHGCITSASVNLTQPPQLLVAIVANSHKICHGSNNGAAQANVSGGTPAYTYLWSNGSTKAVSGPLSAGSYTVTVTDADGCSATASVNFSQPPLLIASIISVTDLKCFGGSNGSASASAAGGTPSYTYLWNPTGQTNSTATGLSAGSYTVTVSDSCGANASAVALITQPPMITESVTAIPVKCNGGNTGGASASVSGGVPSYAYLWSPAGGTNALATGLTAGTYTCTVTDNNGCTSSANTTVSQPASLIVNAVVNTNVSCFGGNNGSADASSLGGTPNYHFSWAPTGGNNSNASNLSAGTYTITVTDANGCTGSSSVTITQPTPVTVTIGSVTNVGCNGGNDGSANAIGGGGVSPYAYNWSNGSTSPAVSGLSAGSYTVTVTDANGCTAHNSVLIGQPAILVSGIASYTNVTCNGGNNGTATVSAHGGTLPYAYSWSNGNTTATAVALAAGTYTATVTDAHSCTSTCMVTIVQPAQLSTSFNSGEPSCFGMNNGWLTVNVSGGSAPFQYAWSNGASAATATDLTAGSYTVNIRDMNNCPASGFTTLSQPASLTAMVGNISNATCYGYANGSATAMPSGGTAPYAYHWYTPVVQYTNTAIGLRAGAYTVKVTDYNGCTSTANFNITQPSKVATSASAPDSACSGSPVVITASGSGGVGNYSYQWSAGNGTSANCIVNPYFTSTYTVTAIDGNGCRGDSATVTIKALKLLASAVTVKPNQMVCQGDTASIYTNVNTSGSGPVTILWSNGYYGAGPFTVYVQSDTVFTVTVSDFCGDTVRKSIYLQMNPAPKISIPPMAGAACSGVTLWFKDTSLANAGDSYLWNFGDNQYSTQTSPSHTYMQSGLYDVTVQVTNHLGCKASASADASITVYPAAVAMFSESPVTVNILNPTVNFTNESQDATIWTWYFGDGDSSKAANPVHTYAQPGIYYVTLTTNNDYGCAGVFTDSLIIQPQFTIWIPSAFTPNAYGRNDYFTAKGIGISQFYMMIFDRWGNQIFTTNDINRGWDGRANGGSEVALEDVYVYKIQVTDIFNQQHSYIGSVTLIK